MVLNAAAASTGAGVAACAHVSVVHANTVGIAAIAADSAVTTQASRVAADRGVGYGRLTRRVNAPTGTAGSCCCPAGAAITAQCSRMPKKSFWHSPPAPPGPPPAPVPLKLAVIVQRFIVAIPALKSPPPFPPVPLGPPAPPIPGAEMVVVPSPPPAPRPPFPLELPASVQASSRNTARLLL